MRKFFMEQDEKNGFTLIELMIVVAIIGVLLVVPPWFRGFYERVANKAAQSDVMNLAGVAAGKTAL